jgi:hypothetical protein
MNNNRFFLGTILILVMSFSTPAYSKKPDQLFSSDDVLDISIRGPFTTLNKERTKDKRYASQLSWQEKDGTVNTTGVELQVRGNYRLNNKVCKFAPLRLHLDKKQTKNTLFNKQKKLKLVTHCKPGSKRYQQYLFKEYLIYRMFNILSDYSFRVRLVKVTYIDSDQSDAQASYYGFFIENKQRLAKRKKMKPVDLHKVSAKDHDAQQLTLVSVFQFFVGNTDWSAMQGEPEEACCHNAKLLGDEGPPYYAIPYDFDFSGFIAADYAFPNPKFPIKTVKSRYYRGICQPEEVLSATLEHFRNNKQAIYALIDQQPQLDAKQKKKGQKYLEGFYTIINDPKKRNKHLIKTCRG